MTLSKRSLNFFANQYNVAVSTKAAYFRVENTQMNREILELLYKEGLILDYSFNFEDVYHTEKKEKQAVLPFTRKVQRKVDPKLYFFDLIRFTKVFREKLPTQVINDKDQIPEDMYIPNELNQMAFRRDDDIILFIYKILDVFYLLKKRYKKQQLVLLTNRTYSMWYEPLSSVISDEDANWGNLFNTLSVLFKHHESEDMHHVPVRFFFSSKLEEILLDYLEYLFNVDSSYREDKVSSRAQMQIELSQDAWKYQDTVFKDDRIFVFPKYYSGVPVVKTIHTCGGTVVWKHVSYEELNLLKQEKGFTTLYVLSTVNGLILDSMSSLLTQEGGLLLLSLKI